MDRGITLLNAKTQSRKENLVNRKELDRISNMVIGAAIEVHRELGPGLLESVYEHCLESELLSKGLKVERQVRLPVVYKGRELDKEFFIDLLIENELVIELKCVEILMPIHEVQLVTYLKLADKKIGLLMNFNVPQMIKGIKRKVNKYEF